MELTRAKEVLEKFKSLFKQQTEVYEALDTILKCAVEEEDFFKTLQEQEKEIERRGKLIEKAFKTGFNSNSLGRSAFVANDEVKKGIVKFKKDNKLEDTK